MRLKDKAKTKAERRAARKAEPRSGGPPIATPEEVAALNGVPVDDTAPDPAPPAPPAPRPPKLP